MEPEILLQTKGLNAFYKDKKQRKQVLYDINMQINANEIVGLVGESGCGKSTLSKAVLGLVKDVEGEIICNDLHPQMIFQDPYSSLNPFFTIKKLLAEPLILQGMKDKKQIDELVCDMLNRVGVGADFADRKPKDLSGGQRQRVAIGMALMSKSKLIIADEPVSALDVTIRSQILDLMLSLQEETKTSFLFVSHDVDVIYHMCDRILVMRQGKIVEQGLVTEVFNNPKDDYTKKLLEF